jgi:hypothetical protein
MWQYVNRSDLPALAMQFGVVLVAWALGFRHWVKIRIGSFSAIFIESWGRLALGILLVNGLMFTTFRLLLLIAPTLSWSRFGIYVAAVLFSYPLVAMLVSVLAFAIDGGDAISVLTSRYKPAGYDRFIDLTKNGGRNAQLIPRGAFPPYLIFSILAIVEAIRVLKG